MSDVERLQDELDLAKALEPLEKAREAMHADRSPANVKAYKRACAKVAAARQAFREKYPRSPVAEGDAVATPATVRAKARVDRGDA